MHRKRFHACVRVNVLRFLLIVLSMLGPPVGAASSSQFAEEEATHACDVAAVDVRALGLQPPPPPQARAVPRPARRHRRLRRHARVVGRGRLTTRTRVARRLLFGGNDDDDPDACLPAF
jgi:hypothetical protein